MKEPDSASASRLDELPLQRTTERPVHRPLERPAADAPAAYYTTIEAGRVRLDTDSGNASWDGEALALSRTERLLLRALAERAGRVVLRDVLEQAMHGSERVESNSLEVHVHALRRKMSTDAIRTVRGLGYLLSRDEGRS